MLIRFWLDDRGTTAIEFCFIAGLISIAIMAGASSIGAKLPGRFQPIANGLS